MLSNDDIKDIIEDCEKHNRMVSTRDIAYALLCMSVEDSRVAYRCVFGSDASFDIDLHGVYDSSDAITYLKQYMPYAVDRSNGRKVSKSDKSDISFDENKAYMLKLKAETEQAMADGEIDKKDGLMILKDIAVKLNDKFNISDTANNNTIIVNKKFNAICARCGSEIYIPTKQDLMDKYNLVDKKQHE